ncbi:hypothetical protein [Comamonas sp. JC664]|uniref:hypothetical protein n=1 Tax=Comamonas sp. JC664 TaxID=2801917 RepID=UPI0036168710
MRWKKKAQTPICHRPFRWRLCAQLDEREAPVAAHVRHLAFNVQPLRARAAIVADRQAAGQLLLAVLLYACVNWVGVREPAAHCRHAAGCQLARAGKPARR